MNRIKFSHNYPKLYGQTSGELLAVKLLDSKGLHKDLIEYDTKYADDGDYDEYHTDFEGDIEHRHYPLPKGKLVQLIFLGNKGIPFCTIRSQVGYKGRDKYIYYTSHIGEIFDVVIDEAIIKEG